mgnify:CR=1 FL=1
MNRNISDKDKKDWENFLSKSEKLQDKDRIKEELKNIKTKHIDLHGFSLDEANKKIKNFIVECFDSHVSKIIVITGKGLHSNNELNPYISKELGILKHSVPEFIKNDHELINLIVEIKEANIEDGGSGSFYIYLRKKK